MDGKTHSGTEYGKERYRGKGNIPLPPREPRGKASSSLGKGRSGRQGEGRQARPQPNLGRDRAEALMRRVAGKIEKRQDAGRTPVGRKGTGARPAPGVGPARPMTLEERSGRFLTEGNN